MAELAQGFLGTVVRLLAASWLPADLLNTLFCHLMPVGVCLPRLLPLVPLRPPGKPCLATLTQSVTSLIPLDRMLPSLSFSTSPNLDSASLRAESIPQPIISAGGPCTTLCGVTETSQLSLLPRPLVTHLLCLFLLCSLIPRTAVDPYPPPHPTKAFYARKPTQDCQLGFSTFFSHKGKANWGK